MDNTLEYLLISDLDDTLLGDTDALEHFVAYRESIADRVRLSLVYASGRFYESIRGDIENTPLLPPVVVIGGVGSEIRTFPDGTEFEAWRQRMSNGWSAERVREVLAFESKLELQPESDQSEFKVSYYADNATQVELEGWKKALREAGIHVRMIYSSHRDLDFLPEGVDKGTAARFVADQLKFRPEQVMVAGNSANDAELFEQGFQGIVVNNAHRELKAYADGDSAYLSPYNMAAGVQDGVQYWLDRRKP